MSGVLAYCVEDAAGDGVTVPILCVFQSIGGRVGFDLAESEALLIEFLSRAFYLDGRELRHPQGMDAWSVIREIRLPGSVQSLSLCYFGDSTTNEDALVVAVTSLLEEVNDVRSDDHLLGLVAAHSRAVVEAGFQLVWVLPGEVDIRIYPGEGEALSLLLDLAERNGITVREVASVSSLPSW